MRQTLFVLGLLLAAGVTSSGCSTTGHFKLPSDTRLQVTDRRADLNSAGDWTTSPFFWSETGGAHYQVLDRNGKVIRSGKLKTHFRVVSIFWPPLAIIYWPMGFGGDYDLTVPADGFNVQDDAVADRTATHARSKKK